MTEQELRDIIYQTVLEVLGLEAPSRPQPEPNTALVLFTGALLGFDEAIESLKRIKASGVDLSFVQTESAKRILDQQKIASVGMVEREKSMVGNHEMLIIPTMTVNLAAKVACGIADDLASNVFGEFIQSNRIVVASRTACCPDSTQKRMIFPDMPEAYREVLRNNLRALASFGVALTDASRLDTAIDRAFAKRGIDRTPIGGSVQSQLVKESPTSSTVQDRRSVAFSGKLLSFGDVRQLGRDCVLVVSPSTIITDLARDAARDQGITIEVRS